MATNFIKITVADALREYQQRYQAAWALGMDAAAAQIRAEAHAFIKGVALCLSPKFDGEEMLRNAGL